METYLICSNLCVQQRGNLENHGKLYVQTNVCNKEEIIDAHMYENLYDQNYGKIDRRQKLNNKILPNL